LNWDSVPAQGVVRYALEGTVVGQPHEWALNSCSNSNEVGAQNGQPHQIPKKPYLQEKDMPVASGTPCPVAMRDSAEK